MADAPAPPAPSVAVPDASAAADASAASATPEVAAGAEAAAAPAPVPAAIPDPPETAATPAPPETTPAAAAAPALVQRHHWLVRVTHWANAVLLVGMIASGLQIYGAFPYFGPRGGPYLPSPWQGEKLPEWMRLGGWLAGGLNWHFALAWPFVAVGLAYLLYLGTSGEWRSLLFRPRDVPRALQMQLYYLRLRKEHPPQGKHNALQKGAYSAIVALAAVSVLSGFAIYKPVQLWWLTAAFGGYELARYWHFWAVWLFVAFSVVHVVMVFAVDPASLRAIVTGKYRGRFPSHD